VVVPRSPVSSPSWLHLAFLERRNRAFTSLLSL
jgi:hypothetical protein